MEMIAWGIAWMGPLFGFSALAVISQRRFDLQQSIYQRLGVDTELQGDE